MRTTVSIILLAALLLSARGEHTGVEMTPTNSLIGTNTFVYTNPAPVSGWVKSISTLSTGGTSTQTITTVANRGSSLGTAKTLLPATVVPVAGAVSNLVVNSGTNFQSSVFLDNDYIVYRVDNAAITSSITAKSVIIVDE